MSHKIEHMKERSVGTPERQDPLRDERHLLYECYRWCTKGKGKVNRCFIVDPLFGSVTEKICGSLTIS